MSVSVIINGKFLSERMQGIVRYARELIMALDSLVSSSDDIRIVVPHNSIDVPDFSNIKVVKYGKKTGILWEQIEFRRYMKKNKGNICLNLCNTSPIGIKNCITTIHDIMYKVNPQDYVSLRNKLSRLWHIFQYAYTSKHAKVILTDSIFSKKEIEKYYPKSKEKVYVIPCAWQHTLRYVDNPEWKGRYNYLKPKEFFFSLATLSKNKNGKWIVEVAKRNPNYIFAVAGKAYENEYINIPENLHLLGFISDEDVCSLIKNCRAFIFPSLYEGFGLPPLEALSLGATVIASNTTSLPEVLGDCVHYIDPMKYNINLENILSQSIASPQLVLDRFSWQKSAEELVDSLKMFD